MVKDGAEIGDERNNGNNNIAMLYRVSVCASVCVGIFKV